MSVPPVNYRMTALQLTDSLRLHTGSHLHTCTECLAKSLEEIISPMLEMAVSYGRGVEREELMKGLVKRDG